MRKILLLEEVHNQVSSLIHELCANIYGSNSDNHNNTGSLCKACVEEFIEQIIDLREQVIKENQDIVVVNYLEDIWSSFAILDADFMYDVDVEYWNSRLDRAFAKINTYQIDFNEYVYDDSLEDDSELSFDFSEIAYLYDNT